MSTSWRAQSVVIALVLAVSTTGCASQRGSADPSTVNRPVTSAEGLRPPSSVDAEVPPICRSGGATEDGRLRKECFVGSQRTRFDRLLEAFPKDEYGLPRTDGDERGDVAGIWFADADIDAEGVDCFYVDHVGDYAVRFPAFARAIGATQKAEVVEEANALFTPAELADPGARVDAAVRLADQLDEFTLRYYEIDEDLPELLVAYVTDHPHAFLA